jgi:hypothetical protein
MWTSYLYIRDAVISNNYPTLCLFVSFAEAVYLKHLLLGP